jgi:glycosyltransferase involved in cell wall biosynthesis
LLLSLVTGAKLVVHLHVKVDDWLSPLSRLAMGRAHGLIAVSEYVAESARAFGFPPDRVFCAPNALDIGRWDPNVDGSKLRGELLVPDDAPLVVLIANLLPWKGHEILLRALGKLHDAGSEFRLLIVGDIAPQVAAGGGSSYLEGLQSLVRSLDLTDCVSFLGFRGDVMELLAASDVFALPSFEEPFGLAYLEAMAMAKPVLGLRSGGAPEVIVDGETGLLSEPEDVDGLARNLAALFEDRELRIQMGRAGRHRVESDFSPSRLARDTEEIYCHLLRLGPNPSLARRSQSTANA